ncbi:hypothetical protein CYCD_15830 [Tenuifilaceae bacterium CYCD]|nr:hypothetical protein CYCD_15830 [Tenuifilaceae bacterium CYCD]
MVLVFRVLAFLGIVLPMSIFANQVESESMTAYSLNKKYKIIVCPSFCNENGCLAEDEIELLSDSLRKSYDIQSLVLYEKQGTQYVKISKHVVSIDSIYFNFTNFNYFLSNSGRIVVLEDERRLQWCVIRLDGYNCQISNYYGIELFGLSPEEYSRCTYEIAFQEIIHRKEKTLLKSRLMDTKLVLSLRYYDIIRKKYVTRKIKVPS